MPVSFCVYSDTGRTLYGTVQAITTSGAPGLYYQPDGNSWVASPTSFTKRQIALSEGTGADAGTYTGGVASLATYTGLAIKRVHDGAQNNRTIGVSFCYFVNGDEQRESALSDIDGVPAAVRAQLNTNPVPASNMRGTDNALLAANYVAPANADIASALAQATTAATQSTAGKTNSDLLVARITDGRAAKLDNLDAAISSRSTLTAALVRSELNTNPVPASNMRGTDNALLASNYIAPANADIASTLTQATTAATQSSVARTNSDTLVGRITPQRAGYLDNLSAGAVALEATAQALVNNVFIHAVAPAQAIIPVTGSTTYTVDLLAYDGVGNMEALDSTPTLTVVNAAGVSRAANLGAITAPISGHYRATYTVASTHAVEQLVFLWTATDNGKQLVRSAIVPVVSVASFTGDGFSGTDRTKLEAIHGKLPSKSYLAGTNAADGDLNLDELDGSRSAFKADVSGLATASSISAVPAAVRAELNTNPVPASNMRGTDNALLAASYVAPANADIASALTQATTAATQSSAAAQSAATAATQATAAATQSSTAATQATTAATQSTSANANTNTLLTRLTDGRAAALANLDATVSSRSTFNAATTSVTVAAGTLALESTAQAIKAQTDKIGTTVARISDIPTAATVANTVNSVLTAAHPGNWAAGGDATQAKQDQILAAIASVVPSPPSVVYVSAARTWYLRGDGADWYAPNVLVLAASFAGVVAMDFGAVLNPGTGVSSVSAVVEQTGNAITVGTLLPSQDRNAAHFNVSGLVAGTKYELLVTIQTTDGQTISGRGVLRCEG